MKKNFTLTIFFAAALIGFSMNINAQDNANVSSTATLVKPLSVKVSNTLNFGKVAAHSTAEGTIVLSAAGSVSSENKASYFSGAGVPTLTVEGEGGYAYTLTVPTSVNLNHGTTTVTTVPVVVNNFTLSTGTSTFDVNGAMTRTLPTNGIDSFGLGGTLTIPGGQPAGVYTNATDSFNVKVQYN